MKYLTIILLLALGGCDYAKQSPEDLLPRNIQLEGQFKTLEEARLINLTVTSILVTCPREMPSPVEIPVPTKPRTLQVTYQSQYGKYTIKTDKVCASRSVPLINLYSFSTRGGGGIAIRTSEAYDIKELTQAIDIVEEDMKANSKLTKE